MQNILYVHLFPALVAGGVSLLVALLLVLTKHLHGRFSMDSCMGVQKFHINPTPRVGGITIAMGSLVGYLFAEPSVQALLGPLVLAGIPAFAIGLLEDVTKRVKVRTRLLTTMSCSILGWALTGYSITATNVPGLDRLLGFTAISVPFTSFAVGGVANAINIIDGFHGLASGVIIIILISLSLIATVLGDTNLVFTSLVLAGAVVGFLLVNWPFGKLFLGDGGAYYIGFAVAWLAVLLLARHHEVSAWAPLLVCSYPILEVGFSFVRKSKRVGHHPSQPDRLHLHMLMHRRLARRFYPRAGRTLQNGLTSLFSWACAMVPASWAVVFYNYTPVLVLGFAISIALYWLVYLRLTQFRWCLVPRIQKSKLREEFV